MRMRTILISGIAIAMLGVYFQADNIFGSDDEPGEQHRAKVSISVDGDSKDVARVISDSDADVAIVASTDPGKLAIKLPGGFEAKLPMPDSIAKDSDFDIAGVKLYPGATVETINVNADTGRLQDKSADKAVVVLGFAAPASAATVAGWYEGQFRAKDIALSRKGNMLTGKTDDGNSFAMILTDIAGGRSRGAVTIHDRH
jgi:hypothetical protein